MFKTDMRNSFPILTAKMERPKVWPEVELIPVAVLVLSRSVFSSLADPVATEMVAGFRTTSLAHVRPNGDPKSDSFVPLNPLVV